MSTVSLETISSLGRYPQITSLRFTSTSRRMRFIATNEVKNPTAATPMKINDSDFWLTLTKVSSETEA